MESTELKPAISNTARRSIIVAAARITTGVLAGVLIGAAVGWVAFSVQQAGNLPEFFYPLLMPLLVGLSCGLACGLVSTLATRAMSFGRAAIVAAALLAGISAVMTQSWCGYRFYAREISGALERHPQAALFQSSEPHFGPSSFGHFFSQRIQQAGVWWYVDVALTLAGSGLAATALFSPLKSTETQHV